MLRFYGAVKHHGPFDDVIMEEKGSLGLIRTNLYCRYALPIMLFTDDPEVWMDVIPSDRNTGQNLPVSTIPGLYAYTLLGQEDLSWAFEWTDL